MQDPWSTATPPGPQAQQPYTPGPPNMPPTGPPQPPQGPGKSKTPLIAGIAGGVVVILVIVLVVVALGGGKPKPKPAPVSVSSPTTAAASPTTAASPATSTSPTTAPASLLSSMPSAFADSCIKAPAKDVFDSTASDEVFCSGNDVPDADGILYLQYSDSTGSESYYNQTLLAANGMQQSAGDCGTLTFSGNATNGTYCETGVTDNGASSPTGHQFVFAGSSFNVGSGGDLSGICPSSSSGITVVGWTDDPTNLTALAVSCTSDVASAKTLENHYLQGDYDLKS